MRISSVLIVVLLLGACGDSSPVAPSPSPPPLPQVAGTYTGELTVGARGLQVPVTGRMDVTQAGSQVTVALGWPDPDGSTSTLPSVTGTLTAAGVLNIPTPAPEEDEDCGTLTAESLSINFSGNSVRVDWIIGSTLCGNIEVRGTLAR